MASNMCMSRGLGWLSLAIGALEIAATSQLEEQLGLKGNKGLIRGFGARELGAGALILAQPGVNRQLANGLWSRVGGDVMDLIALGEASRSSRKPSAVAAAMGIVLAVTGLDAWMAMRLEFELRHVARTSRAARARVSPTNAIPAAKPEAQRVPVAVG